MPLNIIVCIKQVPAPEYFSKLGLDPVKFTLGRSGIPSVTNPLDRNALEEALKLKEKYQGKVTVLTMGPPQAVEVLEEALATGADEGVLLCDRALAGGDSLATAYPLACAIRKLGMPDIILCGNEAVDGATAQVAPQLAEFLDIPHVTNVKKVDFDGGKTLTVTSSIEYGSMKVKVQLPAVIAVNKEVNKYRLPTVWGIMNIANKNIKSLDCGAVQPQATCVGLQGSPTQVIGMSKVDSKRKTLQLQGAAEDVAHKAVQHLREKGLL